MLIRDIINIINEAQESDAGGWQGLSCVGKLHAPYGEDDCPNKAKATGLDSRNRPVCDDCK